MFTSGMPPLGILVFGIDIFGTFRFDAATLGINALPALSGLLCSGFEKDTFGNDGVDGRLPLFGRYIDPSGMRDPITGMNRPG